MSKAEARAFEKMLELLMAFGPWLVFAAIICWKLPEIIRSISKSVAEHRKINRKGRQQQAKIENAIRERKKKKGKRS